MKIIVSGGWSYGNIGDEVIAEATLYLLKQHLPNCNLIFTSYDVEKFKAEHNENYVIESVHRIIEHNFEDYLEIESNIGEIDNKKLLEYAALFDKDTMFVMSGGGYMNEHWKSQLTARILEIEIASYRGAQIVLIGQSIGPIMSNEWRKRLSDSLIKCDYLAVRDRKTQEFLKSLIPQKEVNLYPDLAMVASELYTFFQRTNNTDAKIVSVMPAKYSAYTSIDGEAAGKTLCKKISNNLSKNSFLYILAYRRALKLLHKRGYKIQFVLSTSWGFDKRFVRLLAATLPKDSYEIYSELDHRRFCELLSSGVLTISTKMHPLIVSTSFRVPCVAISYNYKVDAFMQEIRRSKYCFLVDNLSGKEMCKVVSGILDGAGSSLDVEEQIANVHAMMRQIVKMAIT